jgi:KDO2-lipid IV(A) lauroyltransferase
MSGETTVLHRPAASGARPRDVYLRRVVATAFQIVGPHRATAFARWLGEGLFEFAPGDRRSAGRHLNDALGADFDPRERDALLRASFINSVQVWIDLPFARRKLAGNAWRNHVIRQNGLDLVDRLRAPGGAILTTPHFGNPAVAACLLARAAPRFAMIVDAAIDPGSTRWSADVTGRQNFVIMTPDRAAREAEPWLEGGGKLFVIGDHFRANGRGPRVSYLGRERTFYPTLALWACRCSVPIIVISCRRAVDRGYHFLLEAHGEAAPRPDAHDPVATMTAEYAAIMDAVVRRHPEQYYWVRRWNDEESQAISNEETPS